MVMSREDYVIIKLPADLVREIDRFIGRYGYRSRAELVKDAVRALLRQYALYERESGEGRP